MKKILKTIYRISGLKFICEAKKVKLGPIQKEDELLLKAIIKMTNPKKCVELGFFNGFSAKTMLDALEQDAKLISYDNTVHGNINDKRFTFKYKSQVEYEENNVDLVFFDASHDLQLNIATFLKVIPSLNNKAIIAIHDTGAWKEMILDTGGYFIKEGYLHRPDERKFVNWIKENYPEFQQIHFHSLSKIRHGMTLLQRYSKLEEK